MKKRCEWAGSDPLAIAYHDEEWGVPVHDDRTLFEFLVLEGAQAGLSWMTILRKRGNYRRAFDGFARESLGDEAAQAVQVDKVGEFEAVTEGSTGGENTIPQAQRANFYAEVNGTSGAHFVQKNTTKPLRGKQF